MTQCLDGDSFSNRKGPAVVRQVACGQRPLRRAACPFIHVSPPLWGGPTGRGSSTYSRGPEGLSAKSPRGFTSTFSTPQKEHQEVNLFHMPTSPDLSISPQFRAIKWFLRYHSDLAPQFVQRLSWGCCLRSPASLFPKAWYFPAPHSPHPTDIKSSEAEANLTANNQVQDESSWPEVTASQAQHPKPEDCVSFKRQTINRAKPEENT